MDENLFYVYLDENDYVYGFGSDPMGEKYFLTDAIPTAVADNLECYRYIDGEYVEDSDRLMRLQNSRAAERELFQLNQWFTWYDEQCIQYQRAQRLGTEFDKDIAELDAQATANAARVKELREIMTISFNSEG